MNENRMMALIMSIRDRLRRLETREAPVVGGGGGPAASISAGDLGGILARLFGGG